MSVSPPLPRLVTVANVEPIFCREEDARRMLGNISREGLWKLRKAGHIEIVKYGAATLYSVESIKRFATKIRADGGLARIV